MKRTTRIITVFIGLTGLFFPLFLHAQEVWTLEKCIDYALEHNIQVKQQAINKNYNDLSNAGNNNSAGQSAFRAIRRY